MISPLDTRITFFGGAASPDALEAVIKLIDAGYTVVVSSHDPREAPALRNAGAFFVDDRIEAITGSKIVITSLRAPEDVENLYLGDEGLLEIMDPGTYCIDLSLSSPRLAREIRAVAAVSDIEVLDAPIVSVGEREQAVAFIGGEQQTIDALSPLFPYLAPIVMPQSGPGEGQLAAVVSIVALAGSLMGAIESISLARIMGMSDQNAVNVLASTSGGSRALLNYIPQVLGNDFTGRISVSAFLDALDVALDVVDELEVTAPTTETAYQLFDLLQAVGGGDLNIQALALLYADEQTCADFGLDWTLVDGYGDGEAFGYEGMMGAAGAPRGPMPGGPGFGAGPMPGSAPHGRRGQGAGFDGPPPIEGFFSRN